MLTIVGSLHGMALHGIAWRGVARRGVAWHGMTLRYVRASTAAISAELSRAAESRCAPSGGTAAHRADGCGRSARLDFRCGSRVPVWRTQENMPAACTGVCVGVGVSVHIVCVWLWVRVWVWV